MKRKTAFYTIFLFLIFSFLMCASLFAQEFASPSGDREVVSVDKDPAKYFLLKPGSELIFKITGPTPIKIYGRILNPAKAGNASLMVNQGSSLIGAMLITPKASSDLLTKGKISVSQVSIQEFNVSDGEQQIKIKSSAKSPEVIVAVEVMAKKGSEQSIELVPLVPLAPLVPPKKEETPAKGIELVPLVPLTPPVSGQPKKEEKPIVESPVEKGTEKYREISAKPVDSGSKKVSTGISTVVETTQKAEVGERHLLTGIDVGLLLPMQSIGGPYFNADFNLTYYPIKSNRAFGLGIKAGFHNLNIDIEDGGGNVNYSMSASIIPLSFLLSYSFPISGKVLSDIFIGGGATIVSAKLSGKRNNSSRSGSAISPSVDLGGSVLYRINKNNSIGGKVGFALGRASTDFVSDLDVGGISVLGCYNFTF